MARTLDEIHEKGFLTKDEVLDNLEDHYYIRITPRTLKYYGTIGLIDSGIKENVEGIIGSVSLYSRNTPEIIYLIKWLQVEARLTLDRICEYFKILELDNDSIKKFRKIAFKYNKLQNREKELEKQTESKKIPKEKWGEELAKLEKLKENFWKEREFLSKSREYINNFRFVAINRALIELGILNMERAVKNIDDYISAGDLKIGKDRIIVFFKKIVKKEVIFLKNKIEIKSINVNKNDP